MHNMRISIGDSGDFPYRLFQEAIAKGRLNLYGLLKVRLFRRVSG